MCGQFFFYVTINWMQIFFSGIYLYFVTIDIVEVAFYLKAIQMI